MRRLLEQYIISAEGSHNLQASIFVTLLKNLFTVIPIVIISLLAFILLRKDSAVSVNLTAVLLLSAAGIAATVLIIAAVKFSYRKTNIPTYRESERMRLAVAEKLSHMPMNYLNNRNAPELAETLMSDCATAETLISGIVPNLYASAVSVPVCCIILACIDWRLSLAAFATIPLSFALLFSSLRFQAYLSKRQIRAKHALSTQFQEYMDGIKEIKASGLYGDDCTLHEALRQLNKMSLKMELISGIFVAGADVVLQLGLGITIFAAGPLLGSGAISAPTLVLFFAAVLTIYTPISGQLMMIPSLMYMRLSTARLHSLLAEPDMPGDARPAIAHCNFTLENVGFSYSESKVIKSLSFTAKEGEITALVGPSGGGKSTVANLLARLWDPQEGRILLEGIDIKTIFPAYYSNFISCVFQNVVLFNDTVINNIRIGKPCATDEDVLAAARAACCDSFAEKLPNGYNTVLAENGKSLSGGERQRIAIARALLKNAPIVILDEATSCLDTENEALVQKAISAMTHKKTVIIIAHRLRTIVNADKIIVIENGTAAEQGTHKELLSQGGVYARMYELQQESQAWEVVLQ